MNITGNTILLTGGSSGIGRGLTEALLALDNKVITADRRPGTLKDLQQKYPGLSSTFLDANDPGSIRAVAKLIVQDHPELNVLINNAGISRIENLKELPASLADSEAVITTNLLGPIRLTAALLPHLQSRPNAAIINVTSGLAFVPFVHAPTYCATKAALHSYTVSLRVALAGTPVEVIEIIPPAVATNLTPGRKPDERYISTEEFIAESMQQLKAKPTPTEVTVGRANFLRTAEATGNYEKALAMLSAFQLPKE
ncbi:MAG TPA: SDR family NAD(P)-dependent oxidoreductase [Candidatus Methylacidiphilales bacterium]|jgi:uncharacterized oxidoreductase|nr:SDR family NAD(P)-dependent oxidoreductase [Candidatus Methylacidiphilales bacterium]